MSTENILIIGVVFSACFNVGLLVFARRANVRLPMSLVVYLASAPVCVIISALAVAVANREHGTFDLFLEGVLLCKFVAVYIACLLLLLVDLPRCLERFVFHKTIVRGAKLFGWFVLLFSVYTLSYGVWAFFGSRYPVPCADWIQDGFYGPLHWLSDQFPAYACLTRELFWWGYGPV